MNTYKVSFATPYDMDNIQREVILAESPEQVHSIFAGCHVIEVEERHAVELASALDIPDSDELERDAQWLGQNLTPELVEHPIRPTYDDLINGAKFTDEHRAEVRRKWNEQYSDEAVQERIKARIAEDLCEGCEGFPCMPCRRAL